MDEPLETVPLDGTACTTAQILIGHLDIVEFPTRRNIDQFILPALALKVRIN